MSKLLTIQDLLREGLVHQALARMEDLLKVGDPSESVDVDAIRAAFETRRAHLRSVVPPAPFRVRVIYMKPVKPGGAR